MTAFYTKSVGVLKLKGKYYFTPILRKNDVLKGIMVVGLWAKHLIKNVAVFRVLIQIKTLEYLS